jgi:S1-C subfamily serine protease
MKMRLKLEQYKLPLTALSGAVIGMFLVLLYLELSPPPGRYSDADIQRLADERIEEITPTPPLEPEIYALLRPSVVTISRQVGSGDAASGRGIGSGVVVDANGSILTAYHVVAGSDSVMVQFFDGTTMNGNVVQRQPERDLAIISVRSLPNNVEAAVLSGGTRQGEPVMALGSPFGLDGSFSSGVVSALGRSFIVEETGQVLQNMIQFDAAVNPGSSGGPLVNLNGHVIGIVSGIINPTSDRVFVGLGFAVPIESASGVLPPIS